MEEEIQPFTAMTSAGMRDIAVPSGQVYITHDQAVQLYGTKGTTLDPGSMIGALYDLKGALTELLFRRRDVRESGSQSAKDLGKLDMLGMLLFPLIEHAEGNGFCFEQSKSGVGRLLGNTSIPIGEAITPLPKEQSRLRSKHGDVGVSASVLEVRNFLSGIHSVLEMAERYKRDLGDEKYSALMDNLRTAAKVPGISEGIAGLLPPENAAGDTITLGTSTRKLEKMSRVTNEKPLVFIIEDYEPELQRMEKLFQEKGYQTEGFLSRTEAYRHLEQLTYAQQENALPAAVIVDYATENDMKLQDFLNKMNIRFPSVHIFISTAMPSLVQTDEIIMPMNTRGAFQRVTDMEALLKELQSRTQKPITK